MENNLEKIKVLYPHKDEKEFSGETEISIKDFENVNIEIPEYGEKRIKRLRESLDKKDYVGIVIIPSVSGKYLTETTEHLIGDKNTRKLFILKDGGKNDNFNETFNEKRDSTIIISGQGEINEKDKVNAEKFGLESRALIFSGGQGDINDPFHMSLKKNFMYKMIKEGVPQGGACMAYQNYLDLLASSSEGKKWKKLNVGEFALSAIKTTDKGKEHNLTKNFKGNIAETAWNQYSFVFPSGIPDSMNVYAVRKADGAPAIVGFKGEKDSEILATEHHPEANFSQFDSDKTKREKIFAFNKFNINLKEGSPEILEVLLKEFSENWDNYSKNYGITKDDIEKIIKPPIIPQKHLGIEFYGRMLELLLKVK